MSKTKPVTFAARLQQMLIGADGKGISAYRLAQLTGIPKQTISRYLHGRSPTFDAALRIALALGVSLAEFDNVSIEEREPRKEES